MRRFALGTAAVFIAAAVCAADNGALKELAQTGEKIIPAAAYGAPPVSPAPSKGAKLTAASYDKSQTITVVGNKVAVGEELGIVEISGIAAGKRDIGMDGTVNLWLSIFRYKRPDGTTNHVAGWNICLPLKAGQTPLQTAQALAARINAGKRPYTAAAAGDETKATVTIVFTEK